MQAQQEECIKKAYELGCTPEEVFVYRDDGVSGSILERPQLIAAFDKIKKEHIDYFIAFDTSRLSRNVSHQLIIIDEIKRHETELILLKNSFQDNAEGRFQLTIMAAVDEYERARLRLRSEMGKRAKAKLHKLTHNPGLFGYSFDTKNDSLQIKDGEADILRLMFKWLVQEGIGPSEITERLNRMGIPSPRMKLWSRVTVRRILSNGSYTGIIYIRRYDTKEYRLNKYKKSGDKVKITERPKEEWVPIEIPPIIDKETWNKAIKILGSSKRLYRDKCDKQSFLLSNISYCGLCGSRLDCKTVSGKGKEYRYYICPGKYKNENGTHCSAGIIKADTIEKKIWDFIVKQILKNIDFQSNLGRTAENIITAQEKKLKFLCSEVEKLAEGSNRIIDLFQKGYIDEAALASRLNSLNEKSSELKKKIENEKLLKSQIADNMNKIIIDKKINNNIEEMLYNLDNGGKKDIIGMLVSEIQIFDSYIILIGSF
ncbi:MAG: recombinase family protein [Caulobacteraceae bacterium]